MSSQLQRLIEKGRQNTRRNGPLVRALATLLLDFYGQAGMSATQISHLMEQWIKNPKNRGKKPLADHPSMRGNLVKNFSQKEITWKVFCKLIRVLQIAKLDIHFTFYNRAGKHVTVGRTWHLNDPNAIEDSDTGEGTDQE